MRIPLHPPIWKMCAFALASATVLAVAKESAAATEEPTIAIDTRAVVQPVTPRFFGLNYEWASTERVFAREEAPLVAERFAGQRLPLNRMAGTSSQSFHWQWAIGPLTERREQKIWPWFPARRIAWGPLEWSAWCRRIDPDAQFIWVFNLLGETAAEAADLVEFLEGDGRDNPSGGINWARRRIELGQPAAVPVTWWEVGNEMDHKDEAKPSAWTVDQYIEKAKAHIAAVKKVSPHARFIAQGSTKADPAWDKAVLESLGPEIDGISLHCYYRGFAPVPSGRVYDGKWQGLARSFTAAMVRRLHERVVATTGTDRIRIMVTEHAMWPPRFQGQEWARNWPLTHGLDGVLATSWFWTVVLNQPGIAAANYHSFSAGPWGIASVDEAGKVYLTALGEVMDRLAGLPAGEVVRTKISPAPDVDSGELLAAAAIRAGDRLILIVVNTGQSRSVRFNIDGEDFRLEGAEAMAGADLHAYNDARQRPLRFEPLAGLGKTDEPARAAILPQQSLTILRLKIKPAGTGDGRPLGR